MRRKDLLLGMAGIAGLAGTLGAQSPTLGVSPSTATTVTSVKNLGKPVHPPAHGLVQVAFVVGPDLVAIDLFGPQAAFGDTAMASPNMTPLFNLYTVAESAGPIDINGMQARAEYTFDNAPKPNVLVVPMQRSTPKLINYIRETAADADITMSICTGAFLVARAGLFDGGRATTHHDGYDAFEKMFPKVQLIRGPRYVEDLRVSSSGGESSGIDLSLRVVERYYGKGVADAAAYNMEYRRTHRPLSQSDV